MPEAGGAVGLGADEGPLARVLPEVVAQVHARLERLRAHRAGKVADVLSEFNLIVTYLIVRCYTFLLQEEPQRLFPESHRGLPPEGWG